MIFFFKYLWKVFFPFQMVEISCLCRFFIFLKRNDIIRFQISGKLSFHDNPVSTERTACCAGIGICNDLSSTGLTGIDPNSICLAFHPLIVAHIRPVFIVSSGIATTASNDSAIAQALRATASSIAETDPTTAWPRPFSQWPDSRGRSGAGSPGSAPLPGTRRFWE